MATRYDPQTLIGNLGPLSDFWQWALSDLLANTNRGLLAEYIVARSLGLALTEPREEWAPYDLTYKGIGIEVKSSGNIQAWHTTASPPSKMGFSIAPTRLYDPITNLYSDDSRRRADIYVFCAYIHPYFDSLPTPLDLDHWHFFVTTRHNLELKVPSAQKTITYSRIESICGPSVHVAELCQHVDALIDNDED